jgi:vacuolar protein sorting-associated protein 13D
LGLILNKAEYELARANVDKFTAHLSLRDGNFDIQGELGGMSLLDKSPYGGMYRERFISTGAQALDFHMHK